MPGEHSTRRLAGKTAIVTAAAQGIGETAAGCANAVSEALEERIR